MGPWALLLPLVLALLWVMASIRIIREYQRGVTFFLGKYAGIRSPGLNVVLVPFYTIRIIDMRVIARDVPPQDVITRDNVSVKVNAVIYFRIVDPDRAVLQVEDVLYATSQLAQTTLLSVVGEHSLDDLLSERDKINAELQRILDEHTDPWGVKVSTVEVKHVDLPLEMRRVMAREAEAERERRAKIIAAEGELQASERLAEAAKTLSVEPGALQLRYLQTLSEVAAENNSTTIFPVPIDFLSAFMKKAERS